MNVVKSVNNLLGLNINKSNRLSGTSSIKKPFIWADSYRYYPIYENQIYQLETNGLITFFKIIQDY